MQKTQGFLLLEFIMAFYLILMTLGLSIDALNRYHLTQRHVQSINTELDNADNIFNLLLANEPIPANNKLQMESMAFNKKYTYQIQNHDIQLILPQNNE